MKKNVQDFYDSCLTSEKQELAKFLSEDGLIDIDKTNLRKLNLLDQIFVESLNILKDKRHLLSKTEEDMIISLARKFNY